MTLCEAAVQLLQSLDESTVETGDNLDDETTLVDGYVVGIEDLRKALGCWKAAARKCPQVLIPFKQQPLSRTRELGAAGRLPGAVLQANSDGTISKVDPDPLTAIERLEGEG